MEKTGLNGYIYKFNLDYNYNILDSGKDIPFTHNYLMQNIIWNKMFVFIKKIFYIRSLFLSNLVNATLLNCISMKNQECKVRPEIINVNSN